MIKRLIAIMLFATTTIAQMDDYPWIGLTQGKLGLISYWSFQNGTANDDFSTNNGAITEAVPSFLNGYVGGGLYFDGVNDRVTIPDTDSLSFNVASTSDLPFSISFWCKPMSNQFAGGLVTKSRVSTTNFEWAIDIEGLKVGIIVCSLNVTNRKFVQTSSAIATGVWTHVVCTYDGAGTTNSGNIYINGSLAGVTRTQAGTYTSMKNTTSTIDFGVLYRLNSAGSQYFFNGYLDEVDIVNRVLTQAEVTTRYQQGKWLNPIGR